MPEYNWDDIDENEERSFPVIPDGEEALFEVVTATDKKSKAGNNMVEMFLTVTEGEHIGINMFDYLVDSEFTGSDTKHKCIGLGVKLIKGQMPKAADVLNHKAFITVEKTKFNDKWQNKPIKKGYRPHGPTTTTAAAKPATREDDAPF